MAEQQPQQPHLSREERSLQLRQQREQQKAVTAARRISTTPGDFLSRLGEGWFHLARCGQIAEQVLDSQLWKMVDQPWVLVENGVEVCTRTREGTEEPLRVSSEDIPEMERELLTLVRELSSKTRTLCTYFPRECGDERMEACKEAVEFLPLPEGKTKPAEIDPQGEGPLWERLRVPQEQASAKYRQALERQLRERERQEQERIQQEEERYRAEQEAQRTQHLVPARRMPVREEGQPPRQRRRTEARETRSFETCCIEDEGLPESSRLVNPVTAKMVAELAPDLMVGRKVFIHYGGDRRWFPGRVDRVFESPENPTWSFADVGYDDGNRDGHLDLTREYFMLEDSHPRLRTRVLMVNRRRTFEVYTEDTPQGTQDPPQQPRQDRESTSESSTGGSGSQPESEGTTEDQGSGGESPAREPESQPDKSGANPQQPAPEKQGPVERIREAQPLEQQPPFGPDPKQQAPEIEVQEAEPEPEIQAPPKLPVFGPVPEPRPKVNAPRKLPVFGPKPKPRPKPKVKASSKLAVLGPEPGEQAGPPPSPK